MERSLEDLSNIDTRAQFSRNTEHTPLQPDKSNENGFKVISGGFAVLTAVVSVALMVHLYLGKKQLDPSGSLVSDNAECSNLGENIIKDGGNAVDVAIGITFCMGVVYPHLTGIGGGGVMLIYNHKVGKSVDCLDFQAGISTNEKSGIPGLLKGLFTAHSLYGKLPWSEILKYCIELARTGFKVKETLKEATYYLKNQTNELATWLNSINVDQIIRSETLADTLELVAEQGDSVFERGSLVSDGIFKQKELLEYKVLRDNCLDEVWLDYNLFTTNEGSGGPQLVKILREFNSTDSITDVLKTLKSSTVGEQNYSSGLVVNSIDREEIHVTIVSGLGSILGSQTMLKEGYILNNNAEIAGKINYNNHYSSLYVPISITQKGVCSARYATGSIDFRDITQLLLLLNSDLDLQSVVEYPRARITANWFLVEKDHAPSFLNRDLTILTASGFKIAPAPKPYPSINVIEKVNDATTAYADSRGLGSGIVV